MSLRLLPALLSSLLATACVTGPTIVGETDDSGSDTGSDVEGGQTLSDESDSESDSDSDSDSETDSETDSDSDTDTDTSLEPERVLFIGNSYTFANDLPALVATMTESAGDPWETSAHAIGGTTVANHVANPLVAERIAEGWDVVVIQGQSYEPVVQPQVFEDAVVELAFLVAEGSPGAEVLLFETWAREPSAPLLEELGMSAEEMQIALTAAYASAAEASGAAVAPAGQAWASSLTALPEIELYTGDGSHPNLAGSFLTAAVFLRALTPLEASANSSVPEGLDPASADALEAIADAAAP